MGTKVRQSLWELGILGKTQEPKKRVGLQRSQESARGSTGQNEHSVRPVHSRCRRRGGMVQLRKEKPESLSMSV